MTSDRDMSFNYAVTKQCDKMASFSFFRKSFVEGVKKRLFHTFGIEEVLIKRLENINILKPTAIQEKVSRVARVHVLKLYS